MVSEFQVIKNNFPTKEILKKYNELVNKYGEKSLLSVNSLVDNVELSSNSDHLFFLYSFMNAQQKAGSIEKIYYC